MHSPFGNLKKIENEKQRQRDDVSLLGNGKISIFVTTELYISINH